MLDGNDLWFERLRLRLGLDRLVNDPLDVLFVEPSLIKRLVQQQLKHIHNDLLVLVHLRKELEINGRCLVGSVSVVTLDDRAVVARLMVVVVQAVPLDETIERRVRV